VYEDILHAGEGSQMYVLSSSTWSWLEGRTFGEARRLFPSAVLLGWIEDGSKRIQLIPDGEETVPGSSLLILLSSDHSIRCNKQVVVGKDEMEGKGRTNEQEEQDTQRKERVVKKLERCFSCMKKKFALRVLILNMGEEEMLLQSMEESLAPGSSLVVHFSSSDKSEGQEKAIREMGQRRNISTELLYGGFLTMEKLREVRAAECDVVISLPSASSSAADTNDAQLVALAKMIVSCRRRSAREGVVLPLMHVIACVEQPTSVELVEEALKQQGISLEWLMPNELEAGALVQILRSPYLSYVYDDILRASTAQLTLLSPHAILPHDEEVEFAFLSDCFLERSAIALGVRWSDGKVELSPDRRKLFKFGKKDKIVVLQQVKGS